MNVYQHILVATDLAEDSDQVLARAMQLAETSRARLSLLHVVEYLPVDPAGEALLPPPVDMEEELINSARERIQGLIHRQQLEPSEVLIEIGQTKAEIKRVAGEIGADLIVLGSRERHGLALLRGGTQRSVVHNAPCDVLAVRIQEPADGEGD
ncbi:universal stress protein [Natronospira bacteriovora]|uniref:Universal stress protein n=1 Tax=Natronospira bacteriovora TaxID=3069753 RepID=A0ABU0W4T3_9GAMM|nr:universal stress protein [Natronospira sp. AB-CW4]MDQ2068773.1 universal stress protein [Natronospira sp. AB-CW4]